MKNLPFEKPREKPTISAIIPSTDGHRKGNVAQLKRDLQAQSWAPDEILVVVGVRPNGRARNVGVARAHGEYLVFIDDDVRIGHRKVIENLVRPFLKQGDIGMTGPSQQLPKGSSALSKRVAEQIPRWQSPVLKKNVESDMVTHMCLCIPKKLYQEVGGEDPDLIRGTDPDLRYRVRKAGYKIVLVANSWATHPPPPTFKKLVQTGYRNGIGSAWVFRTTPEKVIEAPPFAISQEQIPFYARWLRRILDIAVSFLTGKWLRALYDLSYITGYLYGLVASPKQLKDKLF